MKVIFLDIDGVLNCATSKSHCFGCTGIDDDKVKRLKTIVVNTGALIFLISDWKDRWYKEQYLKGEQDIFADYIDRKLKREGLLITDKIDGESYERGKIIKDFIIGKQIDSFVILDDVYQDYDDEKIEQHFIQTDSEVGLSDNDVLKAIEILNLKKD